MTKIIENDGQMTDSILQEMVTALEPIADKIQVSEDHAHLIIGVKYEEGDNPGVQTYLSAAGYFGIIEEGLFSELKDQISKGQMQMFATLRNVVRDLEEEFGISPDAEFDDAEEVPLH